MYKKWVFLAVVILLVILYFINAIHYYSDVITINLIPQVSFKAFENIWFIGIIIFIVIIIYFYYLYRSEY